jgi:two-component system, response regulator
MEQGYILLVEDDPDDEALAMRAFKKSNIAGNVVSVRDGVEALEHVLGKGKYADRQAGEMPALILLDLKMPKVDGLEVLKVVRADAATQHVPVVVFTSSKEEQDLITSYNLGVNSYIRKPVDFDRFAEVLGVVGNYWLSLNEAPPTPVRSR